MNVRGVLFILSVVSTMYRIGSKADLLRRQEEVDAGLGLDVTFTINKSMLCDSAETGSRNNAPNKGVGLRETAESGQIACTLVYQVSLCFFFC